jgi:hypothetical protein
MFKSGKSNKFRQKKTEHNIDDETRKTLRQVKEERNIPKENCNAAAIGTVQSCNGTTAGLGLLQVFLSWPCQNFTCVRNIMLVVTNLCWWTFRYWTIRATDVQEMS